MATTTISNISNPVSIQDIKPTKTLSNIKPFNSTASNAAFGAVLAIATLTNTVAVSDLKPIPSNFQKVDYAKVITPSSVLPFRLTITNIGIEGYDPANPPGIGIQVIGFSNYIL
jgi:hypothetical protein